MSVWPPLPRARDGAGTSHVRRMRPYSPRLMRRILPLLLASCTGVVHEWHPQVPTQLPVAVVFAPGFSYELETPVRKAMAYWNEQAGAPVFVDGRYVDSDSANVAYVRFEWGAPDDPHHPERTELAITTPENVVTFYTGFLTETDPDRETTARHELGHVLGFDHAKLVECLMYPVIKPRWYPMPLCREETALLREMVRRNLLPES